MSTSTTVTIDDHDAPVVYEGTWLSYHSDEEYMGASTWTSTAGSTATVTFTGTKIAIYGTVGILGVNGTINRSESSYAVDTTTAHDWFYSTPTDQLQFQKEFFETDTLPMAQHTLTITNVKGSLYLDYFLVTTTSDAQDVLGSAGRTSSIASTITSSTPVSSASAISMSTSAHAHKSAVPIIAGVVVAVVVVLIVCLLAYFNRRRFRGRSRKRSIVAFPPTPAQGSQMSVASVNSNLGVVPPFYAPDRRATVLSTNTAINKSPLIPGPHTSLYLADSSLIRGSKAASFRREAESDEAQHDPPPSYSIA